ncbi:PQQ-dependent sugar dehydrogenase [Winogradskyella psychrotolerans]|uniref:PQQ-dependent sugar dehydrogenase n=1 Tax=Winogradskyella psychrotolerans TaxID=1344585 RepID=UPI001C07DF84|nr:PQQ-dependent sugar dehydrogenase [Winogradskyella psychrotolerans]MBU2920392.1 PQQ-dependent sugar dehydrogenase [Winogradskyella psychrotolerans]
MKSLIVLVFLVFTTIPFSNAQELNLELFASNLDRPISIKHAGDNKLYVVEQDGYIKIINADGTIQSAPFLDIDSIVINTGNERGLLGLAFHPDYTTNGYFFVNYINNSGNTVISRFSRDATNPLLADASSELIILTYDQPYSNHNGGDMAFASDGFLYIASGDGGLYDDPQNNSQNTLTLLGNILRLDINSITATQNYSIPSSNPFIGDPDVRDEIFAYGLRNPWKFSFDRQTNDLWIADVGQSGYEEINMVSAAEAATGLNYGWRCYEGNGPYITDDCSDSSAYTFPIEGYSHSGDGLFKCSITGGYRYRGTNYPNFNGLYFFADYCSQEIGYLFYNETTEAWDKNLSLFNGNWSTFGEDINGELYIADISSGNIYKLIDTSLSINDDISSNISIYPNPTKGIFNINFGPNNNTDISNQITIYNLQGKEVKVIQRNTETIQTINTSQLSIGIYVLKIKNQKGNQSTHKLVIH